MQIGAIPEDDGPVLTVKRLKDRLNEVDENLPVVFEHQKEHETTISTRHTIDSVQVFEGVFKLLSIDD